MGDVTLTGVYNSGCETEYRGSQNDVTRQGNIEVKIQEVKLRDSSAAEESLQSIPRSQKMGKTACVTLMYLCEGLYIAIMGPTLPDFRLRLEATTDQISLAAGCRDAGAIIGCIIGGMLADRFRNHVDLDLGISLFVSGLFAALKPWMPGVAGLACMSLLEGIGYGASDAVGAAMLFWVWGEESSVPVVTALAGYPLGTVIAPLIAAPFITAEVNTTTNYTANQHVPRTAEMFRIWGNQFNRAPLESPAEYTTAESRLEIPFAIIGSITFAAGLPFVVYYVCRPLKRYKLWGETKTSLKQVFDIKTCSYGMGGFGITITVLSCLFWIMWGSIEASLGLFLYTYAVDSDLGFSSQEASWMMFTYGLASVVGTLLSVVATRYCPLQVLVFSLVGLQTVALICMVILGRTSKVYLWVFASAVQLFYTSIYGDFVAWVGKYMVVYSILMSLYVIAYSVAMFAFAWITGYLYETYTPDSVLYVPLVASLGMCVIMTALQIVASLNARKKRTLELTGNDAESTSDDTQSNEGFQIFSDHRDKTESVRF